MNEPHPDESPRCRQCPALAELHVAQDGTRYFRCPNCHNEWPEWEPAAMTLWQRNLRLLHMAEAAENQSLIERRAGAELHSRVRWQTFAHEHGLCADCGRPWHEGDCPRISWQRSQAV